MWNIIDKRIISQINIGTLLLLFCLMAVVQGFQYLGYIDSLSKFLVTKARNIRSLAFCLVGTCFFFSMLVTNDVALIITVPFTITLLHRLERQENAIVLIVLETIAANLGSTLTPIGNPQNVYLYQEYHMRFLAFFQALLPYGMVAMFLLMGCVWIKFDKKTFHVDKQIFEQEKKELKHKTVWTIVFTVLFFLCILTVLRILPGWITFLVVVVTLLLCNPELLKKINYGLLGKFILLFVIVGNIAAVPVIESWLGTIVAKHEFVCGVFVSQIISNVPAAILLSKFTSNGMDLMLGVNVGGLGTPIASMASMISLDFYSKSMAAEQKKYMITFLGYNAFFLGCMVILRLVLQWI